MKDGRSRGIEYLRISVTDRCNFRCIYCMPETGVTSIAHEEVLSFEEIVRVCEVMAELGVKKIKLTGGEPLVRKHFTKLVNAIHQIPGIEEITLTTNGLLLTDQLDALIEAGITSINVSLDTLDPKRFKVITRVDALDQVLEGIHRAAANKALKSVKVNALIARGLNEEDIISLVSLAKHEAIHVRFIELMPIGLGKHMVPIKKEEVMAVIKTQYDKLQPFDGKLGNGPSRYYELPDFKGKIGFISAVSECFCENCNRIRLTADGFLKLCLHSKQGVDLKILLRQGISQPALKDIIQEAIIEKPERHHFEKLDDLGNEQRIMAQIGG